MENSVQSDVEQAAGPSLDDRKWATAAHAAALVLALITSWAAGIAGALAAFVIWMVVRDRFEFAAEHAKEAVNFNFSMFIYAALSFLLLVFTLGIGIVLIVPLWIVLGLMWLVCSLIAAFKAWDGATYRYPLTIRLFR